MFICGGVDLVIWMAPGIYSSKTWYYRLKFQGLFGKLGQKTLDTFRNLAQGVAKVSKGLVFLMLE